VCPGPATALQKLVGPGTPRPPQPIQPWHVAEFVEGASQGLVLVAFGSTIQTIVMTRDDILQLARGFAALAPARVLWAMSERGLPSGMRVDDLQLGPNTMLTPWVDYNVSLFQCNLNLCTQAPGQYCQSSGLLPVHKAYIQLHSMRNASCTLTQLCSVSGLLTLGTCMCFVLTCVQDVLGHKHTRAFVSHCGVHSINEAAFHGVPVVAVPIQFEQVMSHIIHACPPCMQ
jgi:hypothetical protein